MVREREKKIIYLTYSYSLVFFLIKYIYVKTGISKKCYLKLGWYMNKKYKDKIFSGNIRNVGEMKINKLLKYF